MKKLMTKGAALLVVWRQLTRTTQKELADRVGCTGAAIGNIEGGWICSRKLLESIQEVTGIDPESFSTFFDLEEVLDELPNLKFEKEQEEKSK